MRLPCARGGQRNETINRGFDEINRVYASGASPQRCVIQSTEIVISMNGFAIIILSALVLEFILSVTADALNLKSAPETVPAPFEESLSRERYREAREYLAVNTRLGWWQSAVDLILFLAVWFSGGFALLDAFIRSFGWHWIVNGLVFVAALLALRSLVMLPFGLIHTFGIENRFGFNKTTLKTFLLDRIKGLILGALLGGPLLVVIFLFFDGVGPQAWWIIWVVVTLFLLFVQYLAPTWIMPLFNKYTPMPDGPLRDAIFAMAKKIQFPLTNVLVMDGSRRSTKSNAFFTGFGKHKRIALFDTLIENHDIPEMVAVLSHEMGHYKRRHIHRMMALNVLQTGVMLFLMSRFLWDPRLFEAFYMTTPSIYAGLLFFGALFMPLDFFIGLGALALSRRHEYEADGFAVAAMDGDSAPLVRALTKLTADNMGNPTPHPMYVFLNDGHPPVAARVQALRAVGAVNGYAGDRP
jgi:STE24 endopeptidase